MRSWYEALTGRFRSRYASLYEIVGMVPKSTGGIMDTAGR